MANKLPASLEGPGLPFVISTSHDDAQAVDDLKAMWEGMPFRASGVTVCFSFGLLDGRGLEFVRLQDDCGFPRAVQDDRSQLVGGHKMQQARARNLHTLLDDWWDCVAGRFSRHGRRPFRLSRPLDPAKLKM